MRNDINIEIYKQKLEEEKVKVTNELKEVAVYDESTQNWQAKESETRNNEADPNEVADDMEELSSRNAITEDLEQRLVEITKALERIEDGSYGICRISGENIEKERLDANPAASTSIEHRDK
jgi:RNA polymerase-binding transcription factor DksA